TVFYHIYPLGMCGAPERNDFRSPAGTGIRRLIGEIDRIRSLGANAIYIGPLFESTAHGYDTVDYRHVDRRLGTNADLADFVRACHEKGVSVVLDAVFNHTGRDFFAFKDVQQNGEASRYRGWYKNLRFGCRSCFGDPFDYEGWAGCKDLAKLDVDDGEVRGYLLETARQWIREFGIDGLRLDAADVLSPGFMDALAAACRTEKDGFWLLGEVVRGDYNNWARPGRLDSVTNYELYKGLWSSFNSANFFEAAYSLNRQFGDGGLYRSAPLYTFLDNHDVDRIASTVSDARHLVPLYGLLFTVPGIPSIYYGSEFALRGRRNSHGDRELRPAIPPFADSVPDFARPEADSGAVQDAVRRFADIRSRHPALRRGSYRQLSVAHRQFAFTREVSENGWSEAVCVAVNSDSAPARIRLDGVSGRFRDELTGAVFGLPGQVEIPADGILILAAC
ncbi:MAG: alpha-amylase, partial [Treponemataceae bacterium]|nr:alpha-amylase [Treponemataceae bacterium]